MPVALNWITFIRQKSETEGSFSRDTFLKLLSVALKGSDDCTMKECFVYGKCVFLFAQMFHFPCYYTNFIYILSTRETVERVWFYKFAGFHGGCCSHDGLFGAGNMLSIYFLLPRISRCSWTNSVIQETQAAGSPEHHTLCKNPRDNCLRLIVVILCCTLPETKIGVTFLNTACVIIVTSRKT